MILLPKRNMSSVFSTICNVNVCHVRLPCETTHRSRACIGIDGLSNLFLVRDDVIKGVVYIILFIV